MRRLIVAVPALALLMFCRSQNTQTASAADNAPPQTSTVTATAAQPSQVTVATSTVGNAPVTQTPADGARRITIAEAQKEVAGGQAILVDVRTDEQWNEGHAKGAVHIPLAEVTNRLSELPKDKLIITYCS